MGEKFYTPDGFNDMLPSVCTFQKDCEGKLRELFALNGYKEIMTPGIEYCDIYTSTGFVAEEELYKLTDQKGRLLAIRYDGTVPAARFAATSYKDYELPVRLSYIENMYRFNQMGGGKQSGFTQAGVELLGSEGAAADAEVIALAISSAREMGIEDPQISIGQVKFIECLAKQMKIGKEDLAVIREAVEAKDSVTIDKTCDRLGLADEDRKTLLMLPECQGQYDVIDLFMERVTDPEAKEVLNYLKEVLDCLDEYGVLKYITVDPGLIGSIDYYTGIIFKGYTYEVGFPIISGGRYDNVVARFGREASAVGFSLSITLAVTALMRQDAEMPDPAPDAVVGYDRNIEGARASAIALAQTLRADGTKVVFDSTAMGEEELEAYADREGIDAVFFVNEGGQQA